MNLYCRIREYPQVTVPWKEMLNVVRDGVYSDMSSYVRTTLRDKTLHDGLNSVLWLVSDKNIEYEFGK